MAGNPTLFKKNGILSNMNYSPAGGNSNTGITINNPNSKKPNPAQRNAIINAGTGAISLLGDAIAPEQYNKTAGVTRPTVLGEFTNLEATGLGATVGGPVGAGIGLALDITKNALSYKRKMNAYNQGVNKAELSNGISDRINSMQPDYTGYARDGLQVNPLDGDSQNVEMERNEIVIVPTKNGGFEKYTETGPDEPTHEQGGVEEELPAGALVFPEKYKAMIEEALAQGDTETIKKLAAQMMQESQQASAQGRPFSNGAEQQTMPEQSQEMPAMRFGGKIKRPNSKC